jgi:beta-phosphoglucomutase-like phosphatase (HAD superfamily)
MINAAIFDLDGVLINSEPLWKEAEKKIFKKVGINLTTEMCKQTTGLDSLDTVMHWYNYKPWKDIPPEKIRDELNKEVLKLIGQKGRAVEDAERILDLCLDKNIKTAVASSSPMYFIYDILDILKINGKFSVIHSSENEESGKPHPAVYLTTAKLLNTDPDKCIAFEDSFYGALSAKSARMKVVAILNNKDLKNPKFDFVDLKLNSFKEFREEHFKYLNSLN